jgi:cytochrome c551
MVRRRSVIFLAFLSAMVVCCDHATRDQANKFRQYYNQGETLYLKHCSNCHQVNGSGLGRVYPPVNNSDFMENNLNEVICLIRNGRSGKLVVNGVEFNKEMPGIPELTDLEVAEITTYIYNVWSGDKHGIVEVRQVSSVLNECEELARD